MITAHNVDKLNDRIDNKTGQWFGATLYSAGVDLPVVVRISNPLKKY